MRDGGGAAKNVLAIACGVACGIQFGASATEAMVAELPKHKPAMPMGGGGMGGMDF